MFERLVEGWLDSAGERTYQAPFCQMLVAQKYTVLHSTRHSPIEFGKDIIARAPDGALCAYQLKGNPGSRLTATHIRDIQGQLLQLVSQPIKYPGIRRQPHKSYLVTNGEIDEEAQRILIEIGEGLKTNGFKYPYIEVISRGTLLEWARSLGASLWPAELEDMNQILSLLTTDGKKFIPLDKLHHLLVSILKLNSTHTKALSAEDVKRRISSTALLVGLCLRNFSRDENHYASIVAWTMFAAYAVAACERANVSFSRNGMSAVHIARIAIFDNLCDLCSELMKRKHIIEGNPLADPPFYKVRYLLLSALMAVLWFWCEEEGWPNSQYKDFIMKFIPTSPKDFILWGEGSVPQWLIYIWYLSAVNATPFPDILLAELLKSVIKRSNAYEGVSSLVNPYIDAEEVIRYELRSILGGSEDQKFKGEVLRRSAYTADGLFDLLVRTGLKQICKSIWPEFSRLNLHRFEPKHTWQYCLWRSDEGVERTCQLPLTERWENVTLAARDIKGAGIPNALLKEKYLLMLFIIIMPHRATSSAIRYLGWSFNKRWFIDTPF